MNRFNAQVAKAEVDEMFLIHAQGDSLQPVFTLKTDGTITWRGREVESYDELRAAVLDLVKRLKVNHA